jgi:DNA topoisomerase-6 subunit B
MAASTTVRRKKADRDESPGLFDAIGDASATPRTQPLSTPRDAPPPARPVTRAPGRVGQAASLPPAASPAASVSVMRRRQPRLVTAETMAARQRDISVSEFFAKNRHLLGFDNKRKALLTTVKEAVDNSLDACEEAGILPDIHIAIEQLGEDRFRVTVRDNGPGIVKAQIPNIFGKLLYGSKFHRLKMARGQQGIGISAAGMYGLLTTGKPIHITSRTRAGSAAHHFQIAIDTAKNRPDTIADEEQEVPWQRGTEVMIELVASYAKGRQSVDEYVEQTAIANPHAQITYRLQLLAPGGAGVLPIERAFPRGSQDLPPETREINPHPHGIELGVLMKMLKEGDAAPADGKAKARGAARAKNAGPARPGAARTSLSGFLQHRFTRVSTKVAHEICERAQLRPTARPVTLAPEEVERLYQAMQSVKIMAPPTDCLAPIGVRALLAGLLKEVKADFYTATTRDPSVYRGNPFLIEAALAYGGAIAERGPERAAPANARALESKDETRTGSAERGGPSPASLRAQLPPGTGVPAGDQPARVLRFANRVPLLYQQSACAAFKSVLDVDWRNYGLSQPGGNLPVGPLAIMIHMASVWVPFTSESKEAIADYDEIRKDMKLALQECGRKLAAYLRRRRRQRLENERRNIFERYITEVADALANLTGASRERLAADLQSIARRRTAEADVKLDDDGQPVTGARQAGADDLAGDDSTVIVETGVGDVAAPDLELPIVVGRGAGKRRGRSARSGRSPVRGRATGV